MRASSLTVTIKVWLSLLFATLCGCGTPTLDTTIDDGADEQGISLNEAQESAISAGVDPERLIYADFLPHIVSPTEAEPTWGFIEWDSKQYLVTYVDYFTGEIIEFQVPPGDNILAFIDTFTIKGTQGSSPNTYDSYPWSWRLPMDGGGFTMTCGYGCYQHTGSIYYSTDWSNGTTGKLLESPASCWVMYTSYSSSYGYQVIGECGSAGNGKRYYYRVAHMRDSAMVVPGWWIEKGRGIGYLGNTGTSTGPHVHVTFQRATSTSGGSFSNSESLPISKWPGSGDSICSNSLAGYNFSGQPNYYINFQSSGCP